MADKKIFIDDSPKNPKLKTSPFDHTFATNITGKFGTVQVPLLKYMPPHTRVTIRPSFAFDLQPLLYPAQTNVRAHFKVYRVPLRILWEDSEDYFSLIGDDGTPTNAGANQFVVPYIKRPTGWNGQGTLAEQIGVSNIRISGVDGVYTRPLHLYNRMYESRENFPFYMPVQPNNDILSVGFLLYLNEIFTVNGRINNNYHISFSVFSNSSSKIGTLGEIVLRTGRYIKTEQFYAGVTNLDDVKGGYKLVNQDDDSVTHLRLPFSTTGENYYTELASQRLSVNGSYVYRHEFVLHIESTAFMANLVRYLREGFQLGLPVFIDFPATAHSKLVNNIFMLGQSMQFIDRTNQTITGIKPANDSTVSTATQLDVLSQSGVDLLVSNLGLENSVKLSLEKAVKEINTLRDSIDGADPKDPVCALPFRAVEFIHNYFGRNPRIDPFIKDGKPSYNKFLTNTASGADSTTPVETWNALYETDYFTSCVKEPQMGNAPLVGVTVNDLGNTGILTFSDDSAGSAPNNYTVQLEIGQDGRVLPLSVYSDIADRPNVHRLNELISAGISINDLRNVSTFQRMLERMQRTSYRFENVMYEFFGTRPPIGDRYPEYIGGITRNIMVDKITQSAETEQMKLGQFRGTAKFRYPQRGDKQVKISTYTEEPAYLVGILYFTVTPCYPQYTPKHFYYKDPLDWYMNPEFATIGPQPVYAKELAFGQLTEENLNDVLGYNRPYAELFSSVDEVHGDYLTTMSNYLLQRWFPGKPLLNKSLIEINPLDLTNIFSVTDSSDKIFGQMLFNMHWTLPAPRSYLPRSI